MVKLFVVGYPLDMQEIELIELFVLYGMVHSIHMIKDKTTQQNSGYGFIEMVDKEGADRAIEAVNGTVVRGRKVTVKVAEDRNTDKKRQFHPNTVIPKKREKPENVDVKPKEKRPRKRISQQEDSAV